jgi:hypothetical protein
MPQTPKTRQQLCRLLADDIGWGETAADIENYLEQLEAAGIELVPSASLPTGFVNPYAKQKG